MKKIVLFITLFFCLIFINRAEAATMYVEPGGGSVVVDQEFTVQVRVNAESKEVIGVDAILTFDTNLLTYVSTTQGNLFTTATYSIPTVTSNTIRITATDQSSGSNPFTGSSGLLATIRFRARAAGTANLTFTFTQGSTVDSNVTEKDTAVDLLRSVTNGSYTLTTNANGGTLPSTGIIEQLNVYIVAGSLLLIIGIFFMVKIFSKQTYDQKIVNKLRL